MLQSWKDQNVEDASKFSDKTRGLGISRVGLGTVQVFTDILAAYCCSVTAAAFGGASSFGAEALGVVFQLLFFYFAAGALLDLFRLGAVIATAVGLGADSKTLYAAIETLAGENSGLALVDKAQAAVSSTKVILALNSVRRILKVRINCSTPARSCLSGLSGRGAVHACARAVSHSADFFSTTSTPFSIVRANNVQVSCQNREAACQVTCSIEKRWALQEEMDDADISVGTLGQLSAYFVLADAEKKGFKVSEVPGLTQEGAMKAAGVFAKYDANDDYKLEMNEFKKLCDDADFTLNDAEVKAAMGMVDKSGNGVVEFDEFATWWAALPTKAT